MLASVKAYLVDALRLIREELTKMGCQIPDGDFEVRPSFQSCSFTAPLAFMKYARRDCSEWLVRMPDRENRLVGAICAS
jgi:hypothetical protein